jgi:hypothetical protein
MQPDLPILLYRIFSPWPDQSILPVYAPVLFCLFLSLQDPRNSLLKDKGEKAKEAENKVRKWLRKIKVLNP